MPPGAAAELAAWLPRLPLGVDSPPERTHLFYACEVDVPAARDPQTPSAVYALVDFLDDTVPAHIRAATGRTVAHTVPRRFSVRIYRKGSFIDTRTPDGIVAILHLTGARWPADFGGTLRAGGAALPPAWDTLDLLDGAYSLDLVTRHVVALTIEATYA